LIVVLAILLKQIFIQHSLAILFFPVFVSAHFEMMLFLQTVVIDETADFY